MVHLGGSADTGKIQRDEEEILKVIINKVKEFIEYNTKSLTENIGKKTNSKKLSNRLSTLNVSLRNQDVYEKVLRCHNCNCCFGKNGSTLTDITELVDLNTEEKYVQKLRDHWTKLARITRKHLN